MKLDRGIAVEKFNEWLDFKRVKRTIRERNEEQEKIIIETMECGDLVLNEDFSFDYILPEPLKSDDGDIMLDKLHFKARIRKEELNRKYQGIKSSNADARLLATIAGLTEKNTKIIGKLYTEDITVCESIAVYFL